MPKYAKIFDIWAFTLSFTLGKTTIEVMSIAARTDQDRRYSCHHM